MITTMDAAGRLVLPKAVRDRAQLAPGVPIEVRVVDGHVELEPAPAAVSIVKRGTLRIAEPADAVPALTQTLVDATLDQLRQPRGRTSRGER